MTDIPQRPSSPEFEFWQYQQEMQKAKDVEHLRLLSIGFWIVGALTILFSSFYIFHIIMGWQMAHHGTFFGAPMTPPTLPPPAGSHPPKTTGTFDPTFGYMMMTMGSVAVAVGWTVGILTLVAARCLSKRRAHTFIMVVAGLQCLNMPIGTILGVFTFIVLTRTTTRELFGQARAAVPPSGASVWPPPTR